ESVTFAESDINSGIFRATRRAVLDPDQISQNGLLEVEPGDTITLSYEDVLNTTGLSLTVTDSATAIVSPLYTISVIALQPVFTVGGGLQADILASPRDVFGVPAPNGTVVDFVSSVGSVSPGAASTTGGVAQTVFTSPTIVNPSVIDASVGSLTGASGGSISLVTRVDSATTTSSTGTTLNQPPDITLGNATATNQTADGPTTPVDNTTIGNQISNAPTPITPQEPTKEPAASGLSKLLDSAGVVRAAQITDRWLGPIIVGLAALNLALATAITSWYQFLLRIFLDPAQVLFGRRRRRSWGIVYNSLTKQPIDLAIVRLRDVAGRLVSTKVTDRYGRYSFLVQPGTYRIEVAKAQYVYPSVYVRGASQDDVYKKLYFGSSLSIDQSTSMDFNIPLDPPEVSGSAVQLVRRYLRKSAHMVVAYFGLVLGSLALLVARTWLSAVLLALHLVIFLLFWRLARGKKPKNWGVVFDQMSSRPLAHAVVRIFDNKYNRVLEQQVADGSGRFGFLVGSSTYYLDAIKPGYVFPADAKTKRTDYTGGILRTSQTQSAIAVDIPLRKAAPGEPIVRRPLNPDAPTGPIAPGTPSV
ncbi:MAG: carboxypeptidase-like regulatory domain-containing protein, partial [bacterium]|nr:carboxypeptidase-like regulatory domain-containing protein [bacterium]